MNGEKNMADGFTSKTDKRLIAEAIRFLDQEGKAQGILLRDLHESCGQSSKHKTVRQFASILRLKGKRYEYHIKMKKENVRLVEWREGPYRFYALENQITDESPVAAILAKSRVEKEKKEIIEI